MCDPSFRLLLGYSKSQKSLPDYNLVSVPQRLSITGRQTAAPINEGAIGRAEIFDQIISITHYYARMPARDLSLRVVGVQINIREYATIGIPTADIRF